MQLKFLTLNLWHGGLLMPKTLQFLVDQSADLMTFQEVNESKNVLLAPNFNTNAQLQLKFPAYNLAYDPALTVHYLKEDIRTERGNTTLSRYPIHRHELIYFNSQYARLDNPLPGVKPDYRVYPKYMQKSWLAIDEGKELLVINLHGVWDFHGYDTPERLAMSQTILEHADKAKYVIIAGDSNTRYQTKTIGDLLVNYPSVISKIPQTTFNMLRKTDVGYASSPVDILLASRNIRVISSQIAQVDISDHLPIIATLEL